MLSLQALVVASLGHTVCLSFTTTPRGRGSWPHFTPEDTETQVRLPAFTHQVRGGSGIQSQVVFVSIPHTECLSETLTCPCEQEELDPLGTSSDIVVQDPVHRTQKYTLPGHRNANIRLGAEDKLFTCHTGLLWFQAAMTFR
jgi:hypothetical protein